MQRLIKWATDPRVAEGHPVSLMELEAILERNLWHQMYSFVHGQSGDSPLEAPFEFAAPCLKYINFPMYSHYKALKNKGEEIHWIERYPIFFSRHNGQALQTAISYLRLYDVMKSRLATFSFTGFAGNKSFGLKKTPRFIIVETNCGAVTKLVKCEFPPSGQLLVIRADFTSDIGFPPSDANSLSNLRPFLDQHNSSEFLPVFETTHSPDIMDCVRDFWSVMETEANHIQQNPSWRAELEPAVVEAAQQLADELEPYLRDRVHEGGEATVRSTSVGLSTFLAWNHALGFRRIAFVPFSTSITNEPGSSMSWGGVVSVFEDHVDVAAHVRDAASTSVEPQAGDATAALGALRFFVDVSGPRAILPDWRSYLEETELRLVEEQAYRGVIPAVYHEETQFVESMRRVVLQLEADPTYPFPPDFPDTKFWLENRAHLMDEVEELGTYTEDDNLLRAVASRRVYPCERGVPKELARIDLEILDRIRDVIARTLQMRVPIDIEYGKNLCEKTYIQNLDYHVLFRILWNLCKNADGAALRHHPIDPKISIFIELDDSIAPRELLIRVDDSCAGRLPFGMPERITYETWSAWRRKNPKQKAGVGWFFIAKYCKVCAGEFRVSELPSGVSASIQLTLVPEAEK